MKYFPYYCRLGVLALHINNHKKDCENLHQKNNHKVGENVYIYNKNVNCSIIYNSEKLEYMDAQQ